MSTKTASEFEINGNIVTVTLEVDRAYLAPGELLTAKASFVQKGKNPGNFLTSECVIATPVSGPLELFNIKENCEPSNDLKLSARCEKFNTYFTTLLDDAIVQASGVFVSADRNKHHIFTDPLLIKIGKPESEIERI